MIGPGSVGQDSDPDRQATSDRNPDLLKQNLDRHLLCVTDDDHLDCLSLFVPGHNGHVGAQIWDLLAVYLSNAILLT